VRLLAAHRLSAVQHPLGTGMPHDPRQGQAQRRQHDPTGLFGRPAIDRVLGPVG
jgi:hypothetical protein